MRMVVVLPAPLGPRNPCTSPTDTDRSSPSRARVAPKVFTNPEASITLLTLPNQQKFHVFVNIRKHEKDAFCPWKLSPWRQLPGTKRVRTRGSVLAAAQQAAEDVAEAAGTAGSSATEHAPEDVAEAAAGALRPLRLTAAGERLGEEGEHERRQHRQRLG